MSNVHINKTMVPTDLRIYHNGKIRNGYKFKLTVKGEINIFEDLSVVVFPVRLNFRKSKICNKKIETCGIDLKIT